MCICNCFYYQNRCFYSILKHPEIPYLLAGVSNVNFCPPPNGTNRKERGIFEPQFKVKQY